MSFVLFLVVFGVGMMVRVPGVWAGEVIAIWDGDAPGSLGRVNEEEVVNERVIENPTEIGLSFEESLAVELFVQDHE